MMDSQYLPFQQKHYQKLGLRNQVNWWARLGSCRGLNPRYLGQQMLLHQLQSSLRVPFRAVPYDSPIWPSLRLGFYRPPRTASSRTFFSHHLLPYLIHAPGYVVYSSLHWLGFPPDVTPCPIGGLHPSAPQSPRTATSAYLDQASARGCRSLHVAAAPG